jgi:hypothetical protein
MRTRLPFPLEASLTDDRESPTLANGAQPPASSAIPDRPQGRMGHPPWDNVGYHGVLWASKSFASLLSAPAGFSGIRQGLNWIDPIPAMLILDRVSILILFLWKTLWMKIGGKTPDGL